MTSEMEETAALGEGTPLMAQKWRFQNRMMVALAMALVATFSVSAVVLINRAGAPDRFSVPFGPSVVKHGSSFLDAHPTGVAGRGHESAPAEKHGGSKGDEIGHSDVSATMSTRAKVTANAAAKAEEEAYHKKLVHAMTMMLRNHKSEKQALSKLLPLVRVYAKRDQSVKGLLLDMKEMWKEAAKEVSAERRKTRAPTTPPTTSAPLALSRGYAPAKNFLEFRKRLLAGRVSAADLWQQTTAETLDSLRKTANAVKSEQQQGRPASAHHLTRSDESRIMPLKIGLQPATKDSGSSRDSSQQEADDDEDNAVAQRASRLRAREIRRAQGAPGVQHSQPEAGKHEPVQGPASDKAMLLSAKQAIMKFEQQTLRKVISKAVKTSMPPPGAESSIFGHGVRPSTWHSSKDMTGGYPGPYDRSGDDHTGVHDQSFRNKGLIAKDAFFGNWQRYADPNDLPAGQAGLE